MTAPHRAENFARLLRLLIAGAVGAVAVGLSATCSTAVARVPQGFVGVNADGPVLGGFPGVNAAQQLDLMVASGVESVRVTFSWAQAQPYQSWAQVPPGDLSQYQSVDGIPTSFALTDQIVTMAARRRLSILPVVIVAPAWDATSNWVFAAPRDDADYGRYLKALVQRYGPRGSFWNAHRDIPRVPIRWWQIWNEPSVKVFWPNQPFERAYVALLKAAHAAIKSADPSAKVVLAGMPNYVWRDLAKIYKIRGARRLFDVVAVHPYTKQPKGVVTILRLVRRVMDKAGDGRKPMIASEVSWPSSLGRSAQYFGFETTVKGQASKLRSLLPMLAANRSALGLLSFYYYTWMGDEYNHAPSFQFAGLLRWHNGKVARKPAFAVFRRAVAAMEGCSVKASVATKCLKP